MAPTIGHDADPQRNRVSRLGGQLDPSLPPLQTLRPFNNRLSEEEHEEAKLNRWLEEETARDMDRGSFLDLKTLLSPELLGPQLVAELSGEWNP